MVPAIPARSPAQRQPNRSPEESGETYDLSHLDQELVAIFLEEAYDLINSTGSALHSWSENPADSSLASELQRDVHTLKGSARMAGVDPIADLTHVLEDLLNGSRTAASRPAPGCSTCCLPATTGSRAWWMRLRQPGPVPGRRD